MASDDDAGLRSPRAYRAKLMDAEGRIETTVPIMASDDLEALKQVRSLAESYTVELWDGGRRVTTVRMKRP